ncbi:MAG: stage III sporulation AC/AD family protein [Clostridia bacterium]|nr:stage III sporulation AC/AD family protein [Clostridia bacterium]MBP3495332.1 stage III sporulation AC/AD family protein [Clostridia bacterium]
MNEIKMCGIILCALVVCVVFKNIRNEYSLYIRLAITAITSFTSLALFYPILSYIERISKNTAVYTYIPILIKALGIAFCVQITADACKDAGEGTLAERINLFGQAEIILISLPLIKNLFELCEKLLY